MSDSQVKAPSLLLSLLPIALLIGLLGMNIVVFGDNATGGANQIALLIGAAITIVIGLRLDTLGMPYKME